MGDDGNVNHIEGGIAYGSEGRRKGTEKGLSRTTIVKTTIWFMRRTGEEMFTISLVFDTRSYE